MVRIVVLRQSVVGLIGIEQRRGFEPVAATGESFAILPRSDAILMVVLDRAFQMQSMVEKLVAGCHAHVELSVITIGGAAALQQTLDALKTLIGNEVDDTADGVGHFTYKNGPSRHIFEIWRVGNVADITSKTA